MELAIALNSALIAFSHASAEAGRGTGRTTRMIKAANDGDFIVVPDDGCGRHLRHLIRELAGPNQPQPNITIIVSAPNLGSLHDVLARKAFRQRSNKAVRIHFDHFWIERYMIDVLQNEVARIQSFSEDILRQTLKVLHPEAQGTFGLRHARGFDRD